ncbi:MULTISPECIES: tyrosine-type recombinase/integrase [unclassified Caballeronia]|uniref:tyrosine-type recombinase/integrase n=1 Tax=unclassified Caballeronia TaxID=2646786 RepID=UPI002854F6E5|nr:MULTISPECIES: tyrosine-type recombinase/integrase [unclassified Caballeronia]MDR5755106.1 tyrosine-type recombinase/integrase [Caballeronia sp. LZ024]MDR5845316.1 tyrosine-type recombinase/integrase [Caballeronia sp. LZ031]
MSADDDAPLQEVCVSTEGTRFKQLRNTAIVALFLASGITAAELRQLRVDDLGVDSDRATIFVDKHGPRVARRVPIDAFAIDILRDYHALRRIIQCTTQWLFITTALGKPMQPDTLLKCVRAAMHGAGLTAADESPRLLRNAFGRWQIAA